MSAGAGSPAARWPAPDRVLEGLYLGCAGAEGDLAGMRRRGITHVLQAGAGLTPSHPGTLQYLSLPLPDQPWADLLAHVPAALSFIDGALASGGRVLVHCAAGVSRSPSVVAAYLMARHGASLREALRAVRRARPVATPNPGFLCQLMELEALGGGAATLDARWQGWGYARWLSSQHAAAAAELYDELLGWPPSSPAAVAGTAPGGAALLRLLGADDGDVLAGPGPDEGPAGGAGSEPRRALGAHAAVAWDPFAAAAAAAVPVAADA